MRILPLTCVSSCSSRCEFAQGGGGALLLVLPELDSAHLYGDTMTLTQYWPEWPESNHCPHPTHLYSSYVAGAEVVGNTLRCAHGRLRSSSLLGHIYWQVVTRRKSLSIYADCHLFVETRRSWSTRCPFL